VSLPPVGAFARSGLTGVLAALVAVALDAPRLARRHRGGSGWPVLPRRLCRPGDTALPAHTATVRRVVPRTRHRRHRE